MILFLGDMEWNKEGKMYQLNKKDSKDEHAKTNMLARYEQEKIIQDRINKNQGARRIKRTGDSKSG